jgi:hypothetical protein
MRVYAKSGSHTVANVPKHTIVTKALEEQKLERIPQKASAV